MSGQKEFYFHAGARTVFRMVGGFFLTLGLLFIISPLTNSDPFNDPDIWFMLVLGSGVSAVGLWIILYAQWGRITIGEENAIISTFFGRKTVKYADITDLGISVPAVPYRGLKAYFIRKRTGGEPINLVIKDGGESRNGKKSTRIFVASSFEHHTEIIEAFETRSGTKTVKLNDKTFQEWLEQK